MNDLLAPEYHAIENPGFEDMIKDLSPREYDAILRSDLGYFAERCFCELNPQTAFLPNWHIEVIAAKLSAIARGKI